MSSGRICTISFSSLLILLVFFDDLLDFVQKCEQVFKVLPELGHEINPYQVVLIHGPDDCVNRISGIIYEGLESNYLSGIKAGVGIAQQCFEQAMMNYGLEQEKRDAIFEISRQHFKTMDEYKAIVDEELKKAYEKQDMGN